MKGFAQYNETKEWYTPRYIFDALGVEFDLDPCSPGKDIVPWIPAKEHFVRQDNGLRKRWVGNVWMNPPYFADREQWWSRMMMHNHGIGLAYARTDTQWFQQYVRFADSICFIDERVRFICAEEAGRYAKGIDVEKRNGNVGSILIAYGRDNTKALLQSNLGLILYNQRQ